MKSLDPPNVNPRLRATAQLILLWLLVVLGVLLVSRFARLGYHAFHHDESIHCRFAWVIAQPGEGNGPGSYRYDPVYHGPFLYFFGAMWQKLLPDTDAMARAPFALVGVLLVAMFAGWRRRLGWGTALLLMSLLTLSAVIDYFSRFARNDVYQTAWLAGMIVTGALYLWTPKLRYLNLAVAFCALSYCTKENSYVNNFILCSFVVMWGAVRLWRRRGEALDEIVGRYLPLTRVLVLFGCFSVFVFAFVAIDSRVDPETGLIDGVISILRHSTSVTEQIEGDPLEEQFGYFTAEGREAVQRGYVVFAFGVTIALLALLEGLALARAWRPVKRGGVVGVAGGAAGVVFYGLLAAHFVLFYRRMAGVGAEGFTGALLGSLIGWGIGLWVVGAGLFVGAHLLARGMKSPQERGRLLEIQPMLGVGALVFQLLLAEAIYYVLFSSIGTNPEGLKAGVYDYIAYWFRHQTGEYRIWGVWWYYLPRLVLFEWLPIVILVLVGVSWFIEWLKPRPAKRPNAAKQDKSREDAGELEDGWFRTIPLPLRAFAGYMAAFLLAVYAILNEKVAWLLTYQSFGLNFLAALLGAHWLATHREALRWRGRSLGAKARLVLVAGLLVFSVCFTVGQHLASVFVMPDYPRNLLVYTGTTHEFAEHAREIQWRAREAERMEIPFKIVLEGAAAWPGWWYFRGMNIGVGIDPAADVMILDDSPEHRRRLHRQWLVYPTSLRGWWIWHGTPDALPGGQSFFANVGALLSNARNNQRMKFPAEARPAEDEYTVGFLQQILEYVFFWDIWFPTGSYEVLVCYRRPEPLQQPMPELKGMDQPVRPLNGQDVLTPMQNETKLLREPRGLAISPYGQLAVADGLNGLIRVFNPETKKLLFSFGEGVLSKEVTGPCDVSCDGAGNYYVTDTWNHAIRKFSASGELRATIFGAKEQGREVRLFGPRGLVVAGERLYVTDTGNKVIRVYDLDLVPQGTYGLPGMGVGQFNEPVGITVDAQGRIYVVDTGNGRIQRLTAEGRFDGEWPIPVPSAEEVTSLEPHLECLGDGRLVLTLSHRREIWLIDPEANTVRRMVPMQPRVLQPLGVTAAPEGGAWVSDRGQGILVKYAF